MNKVYDLKNKVLVTYDDGKTQIASALGILAYTDGKPVERREIIQRTFTSLEDIKAQIKKSPEMKRAILALMPELGE